jgi:hypothetical protein
LKKLWSVLASQSVVLTSERRTGKTSILRKMLAEPKTGYIPIYRDLESVHSVSEFVRASVKDLHPYLAPGSQLAFRGWRVLDSVKGLKTTWFTVPENNILEVKTVLQEAIQKASNHSQQRIVLFWDELPMMIDNIRKRAGENVAMEILDALRSIRQECTEVRMIFTGSIGIHHVLSALKKSGYANDATNDMTAIDVPSLKESDATELARKLLKGEEITTKDVDLLGSEIAKAACCVPFYTHHIVRSLKWRQKEVDNGDVEQIVQDCITTADDPWHLNHYELRLKTYYGQSELAIALTILDVLSATNKPLAPQEILKLAGTQMSVEKDVFNEVLRLLQLDHYLQRQADSTLYFRLDLLRRWWQLKRGI